MKWIYKRINICVLTFLIRLVDVIPAVTGGYSDFGDSIYWTFKFKPIRYYHCPNPGVTFYLYTSRLRGKFMIDVTNKWSLYNSGWNANNSNVIVVHGFNGTENSKRMTMIKEAYLIRGDFNVFMVDWSPLAKNPYYLSSLKNMPLVGKCAAQLYTHLTNSGGSAYRTHCVGHSLGAHVCGMISNYLPHRLHKIIGLDPAKPLIDWFTTDKFRLTKNDANFVEIIHTSSGSYGQYAQTGHVDFNVNGGRLQPVCLNQPNIIQKARCSHYKSVCYFALSLSRRGNMFLGMPCTETCNKFIPPKTLNKLDLIPMGIETPEWASGTFYVEYEDPDDFCKFDL